MKRIDLSTSHRTTDPTSQAEIRHRLHKTWKEIEDVKEQIQATIDEIARMNASLIKLRTVEKELHEAAAATASLVSPPKSQHIPADIIGYIAEHLLAPPSDIFDDDYDVLSDEAFCATRTSDGPWPLTYVCHSWRAAILSIPGLWSSFKVIDGEGPSLHRLSTVLDRSAAHPLTIRLYLLSPAKFLYPIISLLVKHSQRWKDIVLDTNAGPTPLLPLRGQLPLLEKFRLELQRSTENDPWRNSAGEQSIFEDAPRLVNLMVRGPPFSNNGSFVHLKFPFHQMKRVQYTSHLHILPLFELDDLSHFANVSDLNLDNVDTSSLTTDMATLPGVTSLALRNVSLLYSLELPSLRALKVTCNDDDDPDDIIPIFLTRHSDSFRNWGLDKLDIDNVGGLLQAHFIDILLHPAVNNLHTLSCEFFECFHPGEWLRMGEILTLLIWTPPPRTVPLSLKGLSFEFERYTINVMPHLRNLVLGFSTGRFEYGMFDLLREVVVSRMHLAGRIGAATPLDPLDQTGDFVPESIPAQLQDFRIRYTTTGPYVTMEDLDTLVKGKFDVMDNFFDEY